MRRNGTRSSSAQKMRRILAVSCFAGLSMINAPSSSEAGQALTYQATNVSTPLPTGKLVVTNAVCHTESGATATDNELVLGGYVKAGAGIQIQAHTSAAVTGVCEWSIFGVRYPQYDETRYISSVGFTDIHPSPQSSGYMTTTNYVSSQTLDTENPQKSTQLSITGVQTVGEHIFKFQTHALTTSCAIPSDSAFYSKSVFGVACLPEWLKDTEDNDLLPRGRFPLDQQPIKLVYSDSGFASSVEAVVNAWNTRLQAAGLTGLTFSNAGNVACEDTDDHCIKVGSPLFTGYSCSTGACGCASQGSIVDGVYASRGRISVTADWNENFKRWVISHELGHLLGLGHNSACQAGQTVMATATCNSAPTAETAQASDAVPVANSVYGFTSTKTCGW